jgi:hypothetical protein
MWDEPIRWHRGDEIPPRAWGSEPRGVSRTDFFLGPEKNRHQGNGFFPSEMRNRICRRRRSSARRSGIGEPHENKGQGRPTGTRARRPQPPDGRGDVRVRNPAGQDRGRRKTLRKHYATELQRGAATVEAKLVGNLLKLAGGSDGTALKAIMFALTCRFGWSLYAPPLPERPLGNDEVHPSSSAPLWASSSEHRRST